MKKFDVDAVGTDLNKVFSQLQDQAERWKDQPDTYAALQVFLTTEKPTASLVTWFAERANAGDDAGMVLDALGKMLGNVIMNITANFSVDEDDPDDDGAQQAINYVLGVIDKTVSADQDEVDPDRIMVSVTNITVKDVGDG